MHHIDADKTYREKYWTNPWSNAPQNNSCMATYLSFLKPSNKDKQDMQDTAEGLGTNT